jgi:hypothetical protein
LPPEFSQTGKTATFIAGGAKVLWTKNFSFYGGLGYQFFEDPHEFEDLAWSAGLSYTWKALTFDVRNWDTNLSDRECLEADLKTAVARGWLGLFRSISRGPS